jgi:sugar phosphate isomerase/epimerase
VLDLDTFLKDLATDGYTGAVSLEVDLRAHRGDPDRLREVMVGMRRHCGTLLGNEGW